MEEPEFITIIEGPTPDFRPVQENLFSSILEGPEDNDIRFCELRTLNGPDIVDRCKDAWRDGRSVMLDYPDDMRFRKKATVVSMRLVQWETEGDVLKLWIRTPIEVEEPDEFDGSDDFMR